MSTWLLGTGQGLLGFVGVILILLALKLISPTQNKVIRSFQVVGSYIVQVISSYNASPKAFPDCDNPCYVGPAFRDSSPQLRLCGRRAHHGRCDWEHRGGPGHQQNQTEVLHHLAKRR